MTVRDKTTSSAFLVLSNEFSKVRTLSITIAYIVGRRDQWRSQIEEICHQYRSASAYGRTAKDVWQTETNDVLRKKSLLLLNSSKSEFSIKPNSVRLWAMVSSLDDNTGLHFSGGKTKIFFPVFGLSSLLRSFLFFHRCSPYPAKS